MISIGFSISSPKTTRCTKIPGVCTFSGAISPTGTISSTFSDSHLGGSGHDGIKVLRAHPVYQIPTLVSLPGLYESIIRLNGFFKNVFQPLYDSRLFSFSNNSACSRWRKKSTYAGSAPLEFVP